MTVITELRHFVVENFLYGDTSRVIGDEDSLIENDLIDSTGVLELVSFVEERFGFAVADAEIVPENFDSVAKVSAYISRKMDRTSAHAASPLAGAS